MGIGKIAQSPFPVPPIPSPIPVPFPIPYSHSLVPLPIRDKDVGFACLCAFLLESTRGSCIRTELENYRSQTRRDLFSHCRRGHEIEIEVPDVVGMIRRNMIRFRWRKNGAKSPHQGSSLMLPSAVGVRPISPFGWRTRRHQRRRYR